MTAPTVDDARQERLAYVHQLVEADVFRRGGPHRSPPVAVELLGEMRAAEDRSTPLGATPVEPGVGVREARHVPELMTYSEVAAVLGIPSRTLTRRVADGALDKRGRRITTASVRRYLEGNR